MIASLASVPNNLLAALRHTNLLAHRLVHTAIIGSFAFSIVALVPGVAVQSIPYHPGEKKTAGKHVSIINLKGIKSSV